MAEHPLQQITKAVDHASMAALYVAERQQLSKKRGERDTEYVKRITKAMLEAMVLFAHAGGDPVVAVDIFNDVITLPGNSGRTYLCKVVDGVIQYTPEYLADSGSDNV